MPLLLFVVVVFVVLEELLAFSASMLSSLSFLHGGTASSCLGLGFEAAVDTVIIPAVSCFRRCGDDEATALEAAV